MESKLRQLWSDIVLLTSDCPYCESAWKEHALEDCPYKAMQTALSQPAPSGASPYKGPISQPCSACSAGDTAMEYHDHEHVKPEFRGAPVASAGEPAAHDDEELTVELAEFLRDSDGEDSMDQLAINLLAWFRRKAARATAAPASTPAGLRDAIGRLSAEVLNHRAFAPKGASDQFAKDIETVYRAAAPPATERGVRELTFNWEEIATLLRPRFGLWRAEDIDWLADQLSKLAQVKLAAAAQPDKEVGK